MVTNAVHFHVQGNKIHIMELIDGKYFECVVDNWHDIIITLGYMSWLNRSDVHIFVR